MSHRVVTTRITTRIAVALVAASAVVTGLGPRHHPVEAATCWRPPVVGVVVDPFREPPCPYCAGNRGQEYRTTPGSIVRAVSAGMVSWSGVIDGIRYVVVQHPDGLRATYGMLASATVSAGDRVLSGSDLGRTTDRFHFGLRDLDRYLDPAPLLGVAMGRPRLVPVDGSPARPAPPSLLRCGADTL